jgi:hypothetical protein
MQVLRSWSDEFAFMSEDRRRRTCDVLDLGATWRADGSNDAWRLAWLRDTGELYLCRADGYDGSCSDVRLLAVVPHEADLDRMLDGWTDARTDPDGLTWLLGRVTPLATAC